MSSEFMNESNTYNEVAKGQNHTASFTSSGQGDQLPQHELKQKIDNLAHNYGTLTPKSDSKLQPFQSKLTQEKQVTKSYSEHETSNQDSSSLQGEDSQGFDPNIYTPDEAMEYYGFGLFQVFLLIVCGVVWTADAMEIMLLSFLIPAIEKEWELSSFQSSAIGSVVFIGMVGGAYTWGYIADRFGRKVSIVGMILFTLTFGISSSLAPNFWILLVCRGLVGFGVTGSGVAFSLFSEYLPLRSRGVFLLIIEGFWTIGVILESLLAWITLYESKTYHPFKAVGGWRVFLLATNIPLLGVLFLVPFLPESHRYYIIRNKKEEAQKIYRNIAFWNRKPLLEGTPISKNEKTGRVTDFFYPGVRRLICNLILLWVCSAFIYYGAVILTPEYFRFKNSHKNDDFDVFMEVLITSFAELPGLIFSSLLINIIGRKKTLFLTYSLAGIGIGLLGIITNRWLLILSAILVRGMVMGASCTVWVVSSESLPTSIRNLGIGLSSSSSRIAGALTPFISSFLLKINPYIPIFTYIAISVIGAMLSLLYPIETKGRGLPETVRSLQSRIRGKEELHDECDMQSINRKHVDFDGYSMRSIQHEDSDGENDDVDSY